ncbi:hypothetical protein B0H63DRAFT_27934 [Podospora didyma]|uniref:Uncharacterized protein n=1 Tax=Podospora didyma TaxID=330526 RepID=A0AAE0P5I2_9PEZI|nr:hypothetical protein B0H63DRAFT_27934 [Podospora didyma]
MGAEYRMLVSLVLSWLGSAQRRVPDFQGLPAEKSPQKCFQRAIATAKAGTGSLNKSPVSPLCFGVGPAFSQPLAANSQVREASWPVHSKAARKSLGIYLQAGITQPACLERWALHHRFPPTPNFATQKVITSSFREQPEPRTQLNNNIKSNWKSKPRP